MDCKTVKEILGEFVDKEPDEEKESQAREHLLDCSDCRRELNTILSIDNALKSLASKKAKPSFDFIHKIPEQLKQSFKVFF